MATIKSILFKNFATIGIPDFEEELSKNWSIVGLSEYLIDEERLEGFQHLSTRRLDLVIHNGSKFAFMNLQAFKIFECEVATKTIGECVAHYLTPNGKLLFGMQPSGDVLVLTDSLQKLKHIKKPPFIKLQPRQTKWYDIPGKLAEFFSGSKSKANQVNPEATLQSIQITDGRTMSSSSTLAWWEAGVVSAFTYSGLSESFKCQFPYLTSLLDGLAVFCAFSPADCYLFLSSYETALRTKSIANIRGNQVPGQWYKIIMQKGFIAKWLEERRGNPCFEARLCYNNEDFEESVVSGAMLYGVMENMRLELVYGTIKRRTDKFTMSWEMLQVDVDWALRESDAEPYNLGARFVAKLSSDCTKVAIAISNHLGMYIHVQDIATYVQHPISVKRQRISLCNHSDYDGCHFYKQDCWISDVQWLVENAYFAVMTLCGSLSIFYSSGEPMIVKVRKPGPEPDEGKSGRFYFPVFHPHQIITAKKQQHSEQLAPSPTTEQMYPTIKWIDSEQVLTCSSGKKIELFSIQRVIPITLGKEQSEIWLGEGKSDRVNAGRRQVSFAEIQESYATASYNSFTSGRRSSASRHSVPDDNLDDTPRAGYSGSFNYSKGILHQKSCHHLQYRNDKEEEEEEEETAIDVDISNNDYNPDQDLDDGDDSENVGVYSINVEEKSSSIEQLPAESGELVEDKLDDEENQIDSQNIPTPEKLRFGQDTEEYSDGGSSEPECCTNYQFTVPTLENCTSLPDLGQAVGRNPLRKHSQQYMADDEAEDDDDKVLTNRKRKSFLKSPLNFRGGDKVQSRTANTITPEESDGCPPSTSAEYETECSPETYSSPFSYEPTTGEDIEEDMEDDDNVHSKREPIGSSVLVSASRSRSSSTTVSLQIPPVPVISGVIVPSERQSHMLLRELSPLSKMQPELMRYKPPRTATPAEPRSLDSACFKDTTTEGTPEERKISPLEGNAHFFAFHEDEEEEEEEEADFHQCQDSVMMLMTTNNGASNITNFNTASEPPLRFRDSSV